MSKKDLKKRVSKYDINIYKMLKLIDPTKTGKYMSLIIKSFESSHKVEGFALYEPYYVGGNMDDIRRKCNNELEDRVIEYIIDVIGIDKITTINEFDKLLNKGKMRENDIQKYNSIDELGVSISEYEESREGNNIHEYHTIYGDDRWLIIKPYSYYTSKRYGASTKWCTSSRETIRHFVEYSRDGILIYIIDKNTNSKWATHWNISNEMVKRDLTWWDVADERVDSMQVEIPFGIMNMVKDHLWSETKPNMEYFSKESIQNLRELKEKESSSISFGITRSDETNRKEQLTNSTVLSPPLVSLTPWMENLEITTTSTSFVGDIPEYQTNSTDEMVAITMGYIETIKKMEDIDS